MKSLNREGDSRLKNEAKLLLHILRRKRIKRKELEELLDVTPSTMTYLVDKLRDYLDIEEETSGVGKPPQFLTISKNAWRILSIAVGREKIRAVIYNGHGEEQESYVQRVRSEHLSSEVINDLLLSILEKFYDYDALGIAFSGLVMGDKVHSKILKLDGYDPVRGLRLKSRDVPYVVISDVEAIAAYESKTTGKDRVFVLNYGTGLGACYYEHHALFTRDEFKNIPFGHMYAGGDEKCYCGNVGCLETVASDYVAVKNYLKREISFVEFIENEEQFADELRTVRSMYKSNSKKYDQLHEQIFDYLSMFVGNTAILLGVDEITLYGEGVSEHFCSRLQAKVRERFGRDLVKLRNGNASDAVERGVSLEAAIALVRSRFGK